MSKIPHLIHIITINIITKTTNILKSGNQASNSAAYVPIATPGTLSEKTAKYAIWSVVMVAISFLNTFFGGYAIFLIIILGVCFGFAAVKTRRRTLVIVGIALNFAAVALFIALLIFNYLIYNRCPTAPL